jgi:hypothetical protein
MAHHRRKRPRRQLKLRKVHQPCAAQPDDLKPRPSERRRLQKDE